MDSTTIEVKLVNSNGCDLGEWDQKIINSDVTNAVIECLIKNHITLVAGDTIIINEA